MFALACLLLLAGLASAQLKYEDHHISSVSVTLGAQGQTNTQSVEEYRVIARDAIGDVYATPRIRDAIEALYNTKRVDTIAVSANLTRQAMLTSRST